MKRSILHLTKLEDFKLWLDQQGIRHRPGKGSYQVLQVQTPTDGWQVVFITNANPEHFSINQKLVPTVRRFVGESV